MMAGDPGNRYRKIYLETWRIQRSLSRDAGQIFIYLEGNPAHHYSGLFHIHADDIAADCHITVNRARRALLELDRQGFIVFDPRRSLVFVPGMMRRQYRNLTEKNWIGVRNHIESMGSGSKSCIEFARYYQNSFPDLGAYIPKLCIENRNKDPENNEAGPMRSADSHPMRSADSHGMYREHRTGNRDLGSREEGEREREKGSTPAPPVSQGSTVPPSGGPNRGTIPEPEPNSKPASIEGREDPSPPRGDLPKGNGRRRPKGPQKVISPEEITEWGKRIEAARKRKEAEAEG